MRAVLAMVVWVWATAAAMAAAAGEVRLSVAEPAGVARTQWPVSSGIPFAAGALGNDQAVAIFDEAGRELSLQTEPLVWWPDGSIRWLLLDFQLDLAAAETKKLTLRFGADVRRSAVERPVQIAKQDGGQVTINTGPLRLEYAPDAFQPQGAAWLTANSEVGALEQPVTLNDSSAGIYLRDDQQRTFAAHGVPAARAEFTIEQAGPVRACLRADGWHANADGRMFRYVARVHVWRGQPWVRMQYTFVNDRPDVLMAGVRKLELRLAANEEGGAAAPLLNGQPVSQSLSAKGSDPLRTGSQGRLFQVDEKQYLLNGQPHEGRARGWAAVGSAKAGLAVGLREFWQNWPKALDCAGSRVSLELCPELPDGCYDGKPLEEENRLYYALRGGRHTFKVGLAKTHEIWLTYFRGPPQTQPLDAFYQATEQPLLAVAEPAYACGTLALGDFPPAAADKFAGYDDWLGRALDVHLQRRETDREYGMLNYGDWFGERRVNWGNLEYDLAHGMFVQFLRTGERRYFLRGEQAARHHIDVDVIHAVNPLLKNPWGAPPQVGEMWLHCLNHTGGYYENAPLPVDRTYQMGHSTNFGHVWVGGDFEYYCLTGDRRARDVAVLMADAMVRHCPTKYSDHIRGLGWPMVLVLNAYETTGDRQYLHAATACWQVLRENFDWQQGWVVRLAKGHCVHPEPICRGNVPFMEGLTISALARYHRATGDPEVLRAMSVAIDQMIRECWVEEDKAFRYTACPLSTPRTYISVCLAAEGLAYEGALTKNAEHLRVLRVGLQEAFARTGSGDGKSLAQLIHFTPYALRALE